MNVVGPLLILWLFGAVGFLQLYIAAVKLDPEAMPGGGKPAMVATVLAWPILLVLFVVGVILYGLNEVL